MSSQFQSFDEYWSQFLLRSRPVAQRHGGLGRTSLGLARVALATLASRQRAQGIRRPVELRWALAATLLSWGKALAGTLEEEIRDALQADAAKWPPVAAVAVLEGNTSARQNATRPRDGIPPVGQPWAVWM